MIKRIDRARFSVCIFVSFVFLYFFGYVILLVDLRYFDSQLLGSLPDSVKYVLSWLYWPMTFIGGLLDSLRPSRI